MKVYLFPHELASSALIGATKVGNLKLMEGPGGLSREKGYGLFMPTIYYISKVVSIKTNLSGSSHINRTNCAESKFKTTK